MWLHFQTPEIIGLSVQTNEFEHNCIELSVIIPIHFVWLMHASLEVCNQDAATSWELSSENIFWAEDVLWFITL